MNPYENLRSPNIGQGFMDAFNQGRAQRKEQEGQNALMQYALNPDDPKAFEGLAKTDPRMAIQARQHQQQSHMKALEAHRENIVRGAQIVRQFGVKDQASWDAARQAAAQLGIDVSEAPQVWDENAQRYVQGLVSIADAFEPQKQNGAPNSYEEYQRAQSDPNYAKFLEDRRGPIIANNGDGTFQIIPRGMVQGQQGPQPGMVEDGYRFKGGNPADPNAWEPVNGGPTPQASGGFPSSGH